MSEHTRPFSRRAFVGTAAAFGISLCLPPLMPAKAHAVTAAEKQAEANAALEKLNAMQEKLDRAEVSLYAAETERDDAQARMDEAQGRIDSASSRISELQDKLGNRARSMYRSGSSTFLDLLLGATTFQAFASNWDLLNDMNQNDADMVEETKALRSEVESEKAVYEEQRNVAAQKAEEAEAVKKEAESLVSQMEETYNSLSEEAAQLLAEEEAAREAAALAAAQAAEEEARSPGRGGRAPSAEQFRRQFRRQLERRLQFRRRLVEQLEAPDRRRHGRRPRLRRAGQALFLGRRGTGFLRLLRPGELLPARPSQPPGHRRQLHGLHARLQPQAGRHLLQRPPLRHLHRRRPDDPRAAHRRRREDLRRALRHDLYPLLERICQLAKGSRWEPLFSLAFLLFRPSRERDSRSRR